MTKLILELFFFLILKFLGLPFQKRQLQSNSKSRSEKFNPHPEEVASGFPIDPPRPSQAAETSINSQGPPHKRASHSGPLTSQGAWAKDGKMLDDKISSGAQYQVISGVVMGRGLPSDDRKEHSVNLQPEVPKLMGRFPGSFKEAAESLTQKDQRHPRQREFHDKEHEKTSSKDPILVSFPTFPTVHYSYHHLGTFAVIVDFGTVHSR